MSKFTCWVVGDGVVALKCLQILIQAGHTVLGVYSADRSLEAWAEENGIVHASSRSICRDLLLTSDYDYLFSINNNWIIPADVIARARQATINYHNSPLPKYAGLNATSWALIYGETQHAISWHEIVPTIDAGRIFKQPIIPIHPDDTALSLNMRCFEVAVSAFAELVSELAENQAVSFEQDLSQRSYFGQIDRPAAAGILSFAQSSQTLSNLIRALDFAPTRNPLGLPKLWLPKGVVAVGQGQAVNPGILPYPCPGKVLTLDQDGLCVATRDGALQLSGITTLEGTALSPEDLRQRYGVQVGVVLPELDASMRETISQQNAVCRYEQAWVERLTQLAPFIHPYLQSELYTLEAQREAQTHRHPIALPVPNLDGRLLLAMFAAYCARLTPESAFDLALQTDPNSVTQIFAQQVPLRIQTNEQDSFHCFQERFAAGLAHASRLGSYALDMVVRYPELRDRQFNPLPVAIGLAASPDQLELYRLSSAMTLVAYEDGSAPELIHQGTLTSWQSQAVAQQLQNLIAACVEQPEHPLQALPLLSAAEQQQMLVDWNATAKPYPSDRCIHELVSEQAARTPNAPAVRFGTTQLSYQELDQRSNQLARWLQQQGIQPDGLVALCLPRSVELIIGLLGILKAGGAYVPIDPTYPADRIAYLLEDSRPQAVVTIAPLQNALFNGANPLICLDQQAALLAALDTAPLETRVTPDHLAYVIYTSGSTGKPKGVEICHRSLINHSWAIADNYELGAGDRMLQSASISFDVAGEQIYPALFRGAEVIIRPDDLLESFDRFSRFIETQAITTMILPTAFWHEWIVELLASGQTVPPSVRTLSVGTEKALGSRLEQWQQVSAGRVAFFQGYGPTEASVTCTMYRHSGRPLGKQAALPIGRPLPNTEIYILDPQLQPVPVGIVGELYVGGDGLARGYYHRPELTQERFIPHPFRAAARLYKTGDLARFEPDGQIVYCDRTDHQIKLNGFRIELGEIEAVLNRHSSVKQALVHPYEATPGNRSLVAYVVLQPLMPQEQAAVDELQTYLRQTLPAYMVPAAIVLMEALPLMPNGKVNRQALPKPHQNRQEEETAIAPRDQLEQELMQIWQTILPVQPISIRDNFFELGGTSLSAVRLADHLQTSFNCNLPLAAIFQAPTLEQLATLLRQSQPSSWSSLLALQPHGDRLPLFLFQGVELYRPLANRLHPNQPVYTLSLEITGETEMAHRRVEELADRYLAEIRTVQPQGPYFLGGVSFGGTVAFEVAQRLHSEGQEVALLALFDTLAPGAFTPKPLIQRTLGHLSNLAKFGPTYLLKKVARASARIRYRLAKLIDRSASNAAQYKFVRESYHEIVTKYQPQPYSGRIMLFMATDRSGVSDCVCDPAVVNIDPYYGWGNLAEGGVDSYEIPGDHIGILLEPHVQSLAQKLQMCLDEASAAPGENQLPSLTSHPLEQAIELCYH